MSPEDLKSIELAFSLQLPPQYRKFLLEADHFMGPARFFSLGDGGDVLRDDGPPPLLRSREALVAFNNEARRMNKLAPEARWPARYFVIGHNECGDLFAIDTSDVDAPVYLWDHGWNEFRLYGESFGEYAALMCNDPAMRQELDKGH